LLQTIPAVLVVAVVTFICFEFQVGFPTVSFTYLVIVVLHSLNGDFRSSLVVSVVAFLCLNYFFVPPIFSLRVSDSSDTVALIAFLLAGTVITRLTSRAQQAAHWEKVQRQDTTRLYQLAQRLIAVEPGASPRSFLLTPLREAFDLRAVCLFEASAAQAQIDGQSSHNLAEMTRDAFITAKEFQDTASGIAIRLLNTRIGTVGAIGFEGLRDIGLAADSLTALVALAVERSVAFQRASNAAAVAEAEVFRGTVLDALAHEFKTPLTTVLTAVEAIRDTGPLQPEQMQMTQVVEAEASHLEQLTSRVLRLARLDREEVKPNFETIEMGSVLKELVEQYARRWPDHPFQLKGLSKITLSADRELLRLAIGQLLDNACKYSPPQAEIEISLDVRGNEFELRVRNTGTSIPAAERSRIFDRFYRGSKAHLKAAGSGLGLYVARKIATAHGGNVTLDDSQTDSADISFCFTLSTVESVEAHETQVQSANRR